MAGHRFPPRLRHQRRHNGKRPPHLRTGRCMRPGSWPSRPGDGPGGIHPPGGRADRGRHPSRGTCRPHTGRSGLCAGRPLPRPFARLFGAEPDPPPGDRAPVRGQAARPPAPSAGGRKRPLRTGHRSRLGKSRNLPYPSRVRRHHGPTPGRRASCPASRKNSFVGKTLLPGTHPSGGASEGNSRGRRKALPPAFPESGLQPLAFCPADADHTPRPWPCGRPLPLEKVPGPVDPSPFLAHRRGDQSGADPPCRLSGIRADNDRERGYDGKTGGIPGTLYPFPRSGRRHRQDLPDAPDGKGKTGRGAAGPCRLSRNPWTARDGGDVPGSSGLPPQKSSLSRALARGDGPRWDPLRRPGDCPRGRACPHESPRIRIKKAIPGHPAPSFRRNRRLFDPERPAYRELKRSRRASDRDPRSRDGAGQDRGDGRRPCPR